MAWKLKRDIEYVSKIEKAIKDKYGEDATINPSSLWNEEKEKQYMEQVRENAEKYYNIEDETSIIEDNGVLLSKKLLSKSNATTCPVCSKYMPDIKDTVYINKWGACFSCFIEHIEDREQRWQSGWRPERCKNE